MQVIVASKFDNRLKEFAERWEVDRYLSATGYLPATVKPFFVALPKVRNRSFVPRQITQSDRPIKSLHSQSKHLAHNIGS